MNLKNKIKKLYYFSLLLVVSTTLNAQFSPYFQNYTLSEYNAGNHNWDISKSENGKLYVANDNGLLEYDGLIWKLWELPNRTTIRSVLVHKNKIYTGSYEEFGYWEKDTKGNLLYNSLNESIDKKEFLNEEFWQIIPYKESLIFRSFLNIYVYENGKTKIIKPPSTVMSCDIVNDKIYISTLKNGIFILEENKLVQIISDEIFKNTKVISIVNYNNDLLITTSLKGCYLYADKKVIPWKSNINPFIKQYQLNSFLRVNNGNMVFGTIKNGVYITDRFGRTIFHIDKENGLINNTVLGMSLDLFNVLWLGLDNGIASIDLNSNYSFFNDTSGKLGAVYDIIKFNNTIYIGSNTGLYFLNKNNELEFVEGSQGQVWFLQEIKGELFCGHNNGTYLIDTNKLTLISNHTGGWVIRKAPEQKNIFIQGTYTGLVRFKKIKNKWQVKHLGKTTNPIKYFVFEDEHIAWGADAYKGLYRIKFDEIYENIVDFKSYEYKGLSSDYNVRVYNLTNNIIFKTNNGWQKYEPILDSIINYDLLNENFGNKAYIISENNDSRLVLKNDDFINFKYLNNTEDDLFIAGRYFENRLISGSENISEINDSITALNLIDGFMFIDESHFLKKTKLEKPTIESVCINNKQIDVISDNPIEFPFRNNNLSISLSSPKSKDHYFEYSIFNINATNDWNKIEKEKLELSNLLDGEYTILFRTVNNFDYTSTSKSLNIKVLPPWYKAKEGFILYIFLLVFTGLLIYVMHNRKINKEQNLLQLKFEQEQEELLKEKALENEKEMVKLKNTSLKNEIKLKSKQLANTAMALVKKNEALLTLKNELLLNENNFDNYFSFKKILKKVDNSIGHEDEWEIFEYNFNQVHEEFFKQLKEEFPNLTHKDLKICAYIKMNLSTKEIAPLMNISMRGVETHRYRLKKKLNLKSDISVTTYLTNLS